MSWDVEVRQSSDTSIPKNDCFHGGQDLVYFVNAAGSQWLLVERSSENKAFSFQCVGIDNGILAREEIKSALLLSGSVIHAAAAL